MQTHPSSVELCVNPVSCGMSFYTNNYNQENSSCCFGCSVEQHTAAGTHARAAARERGKHEIARHGKRVHIKMNISYSITL